MKNVPTAFSFSGIVKKHLQRGTKLGYPTANIDVQITTPEGIYVGFACFDDIKYPSLIFVGKALTFEEEDKKAEVYILDFDRDIYGKNVEIIVLKKLRENQKFESSEKLVEQIQHDEVQARKFFSTMKH